MTLRDLILSNFGWKLLSLVLATLVWWRVNSLVETERELGSGPVVNAERTGTFSLPVRVLGPARNLGGFAVVPAEVNVTLRGRPAALELVNSTNVVVYVDATLPPDTKAATRIVIVRPPPGVTVQEVRPRQVYVERM